MASSKTAGYAQRHGFRVSAVPKNQTRIRSQYKYTVSGGPGRGGRMYAKNMREADSLMRSSVRARRVYEQRFGRV